MGFLKKLPLLLLFPLLIPGCAPGPREPIARQEFTQERTVTRSGIEIASIFYESEGQKIDAFAFLSMITIKYTKNFADLHNRTLNYLGLTYNTKKRLSEKGQKL